MASDDNQSPKPDSQKTVISSVAPTGVAIGTQIMGTFEITEHIATGGMGEVYRGFNIHTEEPVAIKIVLAALAHDEKIISLFQKEATVLGRLHHDAIVRYMLFTVDPGIQRACLVMEFVEGRSLADFYAEEGKMPCEDVKTMMRRVASGLQKAHDLGVVHRDLSPDNVVIQDGLISHTKIIDFGIAKSANFGGGTLLGGQFAGKYGYVSPEQLGRFKGVIEGTSDIYSLALVAAAACRGEPVDMGDSPAEAVERRMDVPDLSGVHDELRPLLERMLQPDPKDRPQSMQDVLHLIDNPALLSGAAGAAPAAGAPVPPQGSVPPQYSVPPQGSVPPQYSVPPQGSVPPQYSVPPQGSVPPQYSVPPNQFTTPPGGGETVISTPPGFTPTQPPAVDMGGESPFPAQQTGVGRTLPPQAAPGMTMPPQQAEPAKKGKGGLIAALLALVVIGGGGAGAYFGGFIPGVGPGDDPVTEPGDEVIAGNETGTGTDPANNGSTGADTDTPDGDTIDFGDTSRPVTPDTGTPGTDTAGSETPDSETPDTTPDSAPDTDTASTDTPDSDTPGSDAPDPDTRLASLDGGQVEPVDGTINPGEGTTMASAENTALGDCSAGPDGLDARRAIQCVGQQIRWLQNYSTPRCVHTSIASATPEEFEIVGYATSVDPFWQLLTDFREAHGTEPKIGVRLVDESQCAVVTFVKNFAKTSEARPPKLTLDRDVLKSGEPIRGTIDQIEGRDLTLFLVDSQGGAYNLTSRLKPQEDGSSTFALALHPQGAAGREIVPYLMLVIASDQPIGSSDTQAGTPTASLMPIIQAEIRQRGAAEEEAASAALGYFRFDDAEEQ